jgi:BirA family transcriptional regulator, biotin operon repressor / biotin---[acetyl-CoA-carboxylase] ligase
MGPNPYQAIARGRTGEIGWRIHYFESLPSTQQHAAELVARGAEHGEVVIAESQSAGRGRMNRRWHSPPDVNLYLSIVLRSRMPLEAIPQLSLVAGLALAEAVETAAPGLVGLKWPNDLWLGRKKAGGILAETIAEGERIAAVILGIGINVNMRADEISEELRRIATSIRAATGVECDRIALAAALFSRLNNRYMEAESLGFEHLRPAWEKYSVLTGARVTVESAAGRQSGVVTGIDRDGALLIEDRGAVSRIVAGDVSLYGAYD